jgi:ABC-type multidrug transport system fused ATPase/permease subunit
MICSSRTTDTKEIRPALFDLPTVVAELLQQILSAKRIGHFLVTQDVDYLVEPAQDLIPIPQVGNKIFIHGTVAWHGRSRDGSTRPHLSNPATNCTGIPVETSIFKLQDIDIEFPRGKVTLVAGRVGSGKSLLLLALLGEAKLLQGKISYLVSECLDPQGTGAIDWTLQNTGIAYVPQVGCKVIVLMR